MVKFQQVACGHHHTLALSEDGRVYSTGRNRYGQLGVAATHGRHWMDVIDDGYAAAADGGGAGHGELGSRGLEVAPVTDADEIVLAAAGPVVSIAAGAVHSACVTSRGYVYTWGRGDDGQLGYPVPPGKMVVRAPRRVRGLPPVARVVCGQRSTFVITRDSRLFAWGINKGGMLGVDDGDDKEEEDEQEKEKVGGGVATRKEEHKVGGKRISVLPKQVLGLHGRVVDVSAGPFHQAAVVLEEEEEEEEKEE